MNWKRRMSRRLLLALLCGKSAAFIARFKVFNSVQSARRGSSYAPVIMGKPSEKPTATKLTPEQAKLKLIGVASNGDEGAKDCLEEMFPSGAMNCAFLGRLRCLEDLR